MDKAMHYTRVTSYRVVSSAKGLHDWPLNYSTYVSHRSFTWLTASVAIVC